MPTSKNTMPFFSQSEKRNCIVDFKIICIESKKNDLLYNECVIALDFEKTYGIFQIFRSKE